MNHNVLVVATHPDDETLACGGTLLKHKACGDKIHWLIATETEPGTDFFETRTREITAVTNAYCFDHVFNLKLKTMAIDTYPLQQIVSDISSIIHKIQPDTIYLPFRDDPHSDHRIIFDAAYSCTKAFRYPFIRRIYMMEALSETEFAPNIPQCSFTPNHFVNIGDFIDQKIEIMGIYASEIGEHPFPRSEKTLRALATVRGATAGCDYAEAFMLLKSIS